VQVTVQTVEGKSRVVTEEVVGTVRPRLRAALEAKVSGRIKRIPVLPGQRVREGELVASLEAAEIAAQLEQANAALEQAERDWRRTSVLFEQQAVTRAEYDAVEARHRAARARAAEARAMLSYVEVLAPFEGVVTKKLADVGDLAAPGKPLIELEDPSTLRLEAEVPESLIHRVRLGDKLPVRAPGPGAGLEGVVSEIAPTADPASRTFLIKLDLPPASGLRSGQFARVAVPVGESSALRVPANSVVQRGQMEMVFVEINRLARLRLVKTGKRVGTEVELLSGVEAGERVVTDGAAQLREGQPLEVR
jgi:RND family efflux transporter MFP subunit